MTLRAIRFYAPTHRPRRCGRCRRRSTRDVCGRGLPHGGRSSAGGAMPRPGRPRSWPRARRRGRIVRARVGLPRRGSSAGGSSARGSERRRGPGCVAADVASDVATGRGHAGRCRIDPNARYTLRASFLSTTCKGKRVASARPNLLIARPNFVRRCDECEEVEKSIPENKKETCAEGIKDTGWPATDNGKPWSDCDCGWGPASGGGDKPAPTPAPGPSPDAPTSAKCGEATTPKTGKVPGGLSCFDCCPKKGSDKCTKELGCLCKSGSFGGTP